MPYVQRDQDGQIIALFKAAQPDAHEELPPSHDEVVAFLLENQSGEETKDFLSQTDTEMVRIVEDLIDLLIQKNIIMLTDLPQVAQNKLIARKHLREKFQSEDSLLIDESSIL